MSKRSDTCLGQACPFWKRYGESCPNYVEGTWVTNDGHEYGTKDCAPKRSMILTQQIYDQIVQTRGDLNATRNMNFAVLQSVSKAMDQNLLIQDAEFTEQKKLEE